MKYMVVLSNIVYNILITCFIMLEYFPVLDWYRGSFFLAIRNSWLILARPICEVYNLLLFILYVLIFSVEIYSVSIWFQLFLINFFCSLVVPNILSFIFNDLFWVIFTFSLNICSISIKWSFCHSTEACLFVSFFFRVTWYPLIV